MYTSTSTHLLIFPYPAQGHMLALLDLTHHLSLHNFTITILVTPKNLPILTPLLNSHPRIQTLLLPFPSHPSIPPGVENVKELGNAGNFPVMSALVKLFDPIIHWFHSHPNPPVAIISDFFLGWTLDLARHLNIIRIAFFSVSALLPSVFDYCWNHFHDVKSSTVVELHGLPKSPIFKQEQLPSVFRRYKESDPDSEFVKDCLLKNTLSWGCVFNSFEDLEGEYLDYLKTKIGHSRVFGIGPISSLGTGSKSANDPNLSPNDYSLKWLDRCPDGSVLYVCFGSQKPLTSEQMKALALGLEKSGILFLWVVKMGEGYGTIPEGFEERVTGRGLIVKGWAPQVSILNHKAVGGFLSHCGWNSVLEVIVSGVMVLGWPMEADQFVNARLLVEDMGVAVRVCEGADSVPDSIELGRVISQAMNQCGEVKVRAKELKEKALAAVKSGGSSAKDLERLVQELKNLQDK
ncbi:UDP-glycosyltransferase 89A2-like [Pistacia vera]|uniref:UDP-glycosyltransferase 89A2-like n=1 Tax=Pistacia vera TaxID=55513 RepID=UPI001262CB3E|nr:UDP-glycosyltransferase 89A2-like [Pistacia vera]